jgi:hypothetical protein
MNEFYWVGGGDRGRVTVDGVEVMAEACLTGDDGWAIVFRPENVVKQSVNCPRQLVHGKVEFFPFGGE